MPLPRHLLVPLALAGCAAPAPEVVRAEVDPRIPTLVHVEWSTAIPSDGWIEYGEDTSYGFQTPVAPEGVDHDVTLFGLGFDTDCHYRVVTRADGVVERGDDQVIHTGDTPDRLADYHAESDGPNSLWGDYTLFSWRAVVSEDSFAAIADRAGDIVWYWEPDESDVMAAAMSSDDTAVLALVATEGLDEWARIVRIPLDGSEPTETATPYAHHDFLETAEGYAYIASDPRSFGGIAWQGDDIIEVSEGLADTRTIWDAYATLPRTENEGFGQDPIDWTHANGLGYDPQDDAYLVSLYWYREVIKVDRATGAILWTLGGEASDFTFVDDVGFGPQHSPEWVDGGLNVFDNAYDQPSSRIIEYALDTDAWTATPTWSWTAPEGVHTRVLGDVDRLPGGGSVSAWGEREEILTLDEDGATLRRLWMDTTGVISQIQRLESLYPPSAVFAE